MPAGRSRNFTFFHIHADFRNISVNVISKKLTYDLIILKTRTHILTFQHQFVRIGTKTLQCLASAGRLFALDQRALGPVPFENPLQCQLGG